MAASFGNASKILAEKRYPAFYRQMEKRGREYLREKEDIPEALRWLETLDMH